MKLTRRLSPNRSILQVFPLLCVAAFLLTTSAGRGARVSFFPVFLLTPVSALSSSSSFSLSPPAAPIFCPPSSVHYKLSSRSEFKGPVSALSLTSAATAPLVATIPSLNCWSFYPSLYFFSFSIVPCSPLSPSSPSASPPFSVFASSSSSPRLASYAYAKPPPSRITQEETREAKAARAAPAGGTAAAELAPAGAPAAASKAAAGAETRGNAHFNCSNSIGCSPFSRRRPPVFSAACLPLLVLYRRINFLRRGNFFFIPFKRSCSRGVSSAFTDRSVVVCRDNSSSAAVHPGLRIGYFPRESVRRKSVHAVVEENFILPADSSYTKNISPHSPKAFLQNLSFSFSSTSASARLCPSSSSLFSSSSRGHSLFPSLPSAFPLHASSSSSPVSPGLFSVSSSSVCPNSFLVSQSLAVSPSLSSSLTSPFSYSLPCSFSCPVFLRGRSQKVSPAAEVQPRAAPPPPSRKSETSMRMQRHHHHTAAAGRTTAAAAWASAAVEARRETGEGRTAVAQAERATAAEKAGAGLLQLQPPGAAGPTAATATRTSKFRTQLAATGRNVAVAGDDGSAMQRLIEKQEEEVKDEERKKKKREEKEEEVAEEEDEQQAARRKRLRAWQVVLHNDDIHAIPHVTELLVAAVPSLTKAKAHTITVHAHKTGMAVVQKTWREKALQISQRLTEAGLTISLVASNKDKKDKEEAEGDETPGEDGSDDSYEDEAADSAAAATS